MFLLQTAADSVLATNIGDTLGNQISVFVLAGLGLLTKLITSAVAKVMPQWWDAQGDAVKAIVALVFSQVVVFLNWKFGVVLSPDITAIGTSLAGVATWLIAMGWHRLAKFLPMNQPK
jgi:hypothetical protein